MKIILKDTYKSLNAFESEELNNLSIITGKNGSGKTQLLELIKNKYNNDKSALSIRLEITPETHSVQAEGIIKENISQISHDQWKQIVSKNLNAYKQNSQNMISYLKYILSKGFNYREFKKNQKAPLISQTEEYKVLLNGINSEIQNTPLLNLQELSWAHQRSVNRSILNPQNESMILFIDEICSHTGRNLNELSDADFYNTPIMEHLIDENDLFTSQVELIFYNYAKRRDQNRKDYFYKKEEGEENNSVSDNEFIQLYMPPWGIINNILNDLGIDFYFKGIEKRDFTIEVPIDFTLLKKSTEEIIPFNDLSSGEKVIIGLIIKLFTSEYYNENLSFPELLILDEPDAHLHPEMSKLLLDVLDKTFSKKYGIKVIITTHSPSTVALAQDEQVYKLENGSNSSLVKISKDEALQLLTSFIPTLSIDYNNHKQVFVESPTDKYYYETLFNKLNIEYCFPFRLYFISNGYGKGNCDQVEKIVKDIRKSGNSTCYGIIDWDKKSTSSDFVKVHGKGSRYSLENYVYDPIYIAVLFLEMKALNIHSIIDVDNSFNQYNLGEDPQLIRKTVDWFFNTYYEKHKIPEDAKQLMRTANYHNGIKIDLPVWFLEFQGHDLEERLKLAFPPLDKFKDEGKLQKELSVISAKCFPFIHEDTVQTIREIIGIE